MKIKTSQKLFFSEIFLQYLEQQNIEYWKQFFNIIYYARYVDDIFIVYDTKYDIAKDVSKKIDDIHSELVFTLEKGIINAKFSGSWHQIYVTDIFMVGVRIREFSRLVSSSSYLCFRIIYLQKNYLSS